MRKLTKQDFWNKVENANDDACWLWPLSKDEYGYGTIKFCGKWFRTHRLAWQLTHGDIPRDMKVLHRCDNPSCVNPRHLFLGSDADNLKDAAIKNRMTHKLSINDVIAIRHLVSCGCSQKDTASRFGVRCNTISRIVNRKRRQHV